MALSTFDWQQPDTSDPARLALAAIQERRIGQDSMIRNALAMQPDPAQQPKTPDYASMIMGQFQSALALKKKNELLDASNQRDQEVHQARLAESAFNQSLKQREVDEWNQFDAASKALLAGQNAPVEPALPVAAAPAESVDLMAAGAPGVTGVPLGKITDYGQVDDPYKDSASLGTGKYKYPTGAWDNALTPDSMALSPDIERILKEKGVKEGDPVKLKLSNGQEIVRTFDDRTMQDEQAKAKFGKPLTGRFDLFSPDGKSPLRGLSVVGFEPANMALDNTTTPADVVRSIPATANAPAAIAPQPQMDFANKALAILPPRARAQAMQQTAVSQLRPTASSRFIQQHEDLLENMDPVPERNTFRDRETGIEYFVTRESNGKQKLSPYRPAEVKASRWAFGSDGKPYALGSNGETMQPIPEGVSVTPGSSFKQVKDNVGNVYSVAANNDISMLIPAKSKMAEKERAEFLDDVNKFATADQEYAAAQAALNEKKAKGGNWFGISEDDVAKKEKAKKDAETKIDSWKKLYPDIGASGQPTSVLQAEVLPEVQKPLSTIPYDSPDALKAAVKSGTLSKKEALDILRSNFGMKP